MIKKSVGKNLKWEETDPCFTQAPAMSTGRTIKCFRYSSANYTNASK